MYAFSLYLIVFTCSANSCCIYVQTCKANACDKVNFNNVNVEWQ